MRWQNHEQIVVYIDIYTKTESSCVFESSRAHGIYVMLGIDVYAGIIIRGKMIENPSTFCRDAENTCGFRVRLLNLRNTHFRLKLQLAQGAFAEERKNSSIGI